MHLEPTRKNEARGPVARGSIGNAPTDWDVDEIDESVLKATVVAPPDTPLQSFARLGEALSEHILGRKFWYEKPKMAESFLSSDKKIVICEANITSGRMYKHIDILDALGKYGLSSVVRSNGWEVSSSSSRLCVNTAPDYISLDAKQEGKKPLRKVGESLYMLYRDVVQASASGSFVLTVGGDRGISSAVIGGAVQTHKNLSVIYVSAFADCNTPATSPSHEYHGMVAAHIMGWFNDRVEGFEWMKYNVPETRVAIIGIREFDSDEIEHVCNSGVRAFSMHEITRLGIGAVIDSAIKSINPRNDRPIHLSFDLSACDDRVFAPSLDSVGGLTLREARFICTTLSQTNALVSMDFVHMTQNPSKFDTDRSAQVALTLISSAVGRRII